MKMPVFTRILTAFASSLSLLALQLPAFAQTSAALNGQLLDQTTQRPVAYASVGVLRRPLGTVADDQGRFSLNLPATYDQDSVRLALIGYAPRTLSVADLRRQLNQNGGTMLLQPAATQLAEVVVRPGKLTRRIIGNSSNSTHTTASFDVNRPGNQIAQGMHLRRPAQLEQVSFHVAECTYDSLFYRINVYQVVDGQPTTSLLPTPVYVRVRKGQLKDRFVADLRSFNLTVQGDIAVALEMVKGLGSGTLHLSGSVLGGPIYFTDQSANGWDRLRGFGVGIDATVAEYR